MNKTSLIILQVIWIIIGIFCIVAAVHNRLSYGGNRYLMLIGMALIAFLMAYIRHRQRKKT